MSEEYNPQQQIEQILTHQSPQEAHDTLIRLMLCHHNEARMRLAAVETLGDLGDLSTLPDLIAALSEQDPNLNHSIARALGKMPAEAVIVIISAISFAPDALLPYLITALGAYEDRRAKTVLRDFAAHPSPAIRAAALQSMGAQPIRAALAPYFSPADLPTR